MELKLDENGHAVIEEGKPVYVYDDGREAPFDAAATVKKITNLTEEKDRHYANFEETKKQLEKFGDLSPEDVSARLKALDGIDPEEAKKAMETVSNMKDGELMQAGQVETLKSQMNKAFAEKENEINQSWERKVGDLSAVIEAKDTTIYELMVNSRFASSPTIQDKTLLPPDIAATYFAKNFKVEGEGTDARVVGYLNGEKIYSKENPGEVAEFEEALRVIIDAYPMKDRIMKAQGAGSGSGGSGSTSRNAQREFLKSLPASERLKYIHREQQKSA